MLWQTGILPTYFFMFLSTIPVAPVMTGMTSTFLFHVLWHSIWRSTYLLIFSVAFFWMLQSLRIATSMIWHLSDSFSCMTMSDLLEGTCLSVRIGESHRIVPFSFHCLVYQLSVFVWCNGVINLLCQIPLSVLWQYLSG